MKKLDPWANQRVERAPIAVMSLQSAVGGFGNEECYGMGKPRSGASSAVATSAANIDVDGPANLMAFLAEVFAPPCLGSAGRTSRLIRADRRSRRNPNQERGHPGHPRNEHRWHCSEGYFWLLVDGRSHHQTNLPGFPMYELGQRLHQMVAVSGRLKRSPPNHGM